MKPERIDEVIGHLEALALFLSAPHDLRADQVQRTVSRLTAEMNEVPIQSRIYQAKA